MLRGNPPPNIPFFLFLSISFPSLFKKKSENFGGGLNPLNPPLKYALEYSIENIGTLRNFGRWGQAQKSHPPPIRKESPYIEKKGTKRFPHEEKAYHEGKNNSKRRPHI